MLAKLIISTFTSFWEVRTKYQNKKSIRAKLARKLHDWYLYENNSSIDWGTKIKSEPCFPHGIKGIFISGAAKIGGDCIIFQQVTIGSITLPDSKNIGAPVIGDNVYIGAGAKVIGKITVGNNVRIGANAVVFENIPDNSIVVSSGQKIKIKESLMKNKYYSFDSKNGNWVYFKNGSWEIESDNKTIATLTLSQS